MDRQTRTKYNLRPLGGNQIGKETPSEFVSMDRQTRTKYNLRPLGGNQIGKETRSEFVYKNPYDNYFYNSISQHEFVKILQSSINNIPIKLSKSKTSHVMKFMKLAAVFYKRFKNPKFNDTYKLKIIEFINSPNLGKRNSNILLNILHSLRIGYRISVRNYRYILCNNIDIDKRM